MTVAEQAKVYKEVVTVLEAFELTGAIPQNVMNNFVIKQDKSYEYVFDVNVPIEKQRISRKAATILSVLYIKYICDDPNEKMELKELYEANENVPEYKAYRDEVVEKLESVPTDNNENMLVKKLSFSEKVKNFFRGLFGKK